MTTPRTMGRRVSPSQAPIAAGRDLPGHYSPGPAGSSPLTTTVAEAVANPPQLSTAAINRVAEIMAGYLQRTSGSVSGRTSHQAVNSGGAE